MRRFVLSIVVLVVTVLAAVRFLATEWMHVASGAASPGLALIAPTVGLVVFVPLIGVVLLASIRATRTRREFEERLRADNPGAVVFSGRPYVPLVAALNRIRAVSGQPAFVAGSFPLSVVVAPAAVSVWKTSGELIASVPMRDVSSIRSVTVEIPVRGWRNHPIEAIQVDATIAGRADALFLAVAVGANGFSDRAAVLAIEASITAMRSAVGGSGRSGRPDAAGQRPANPLWGAAWGTALGTILDAAATPIRVHGFDDSMRVATELADVVFDTVVRPMKVDQGLSTERVSQTLGALAGAAARYATARGMIDEDPTYTSLPMPIVTMTGANGETYIFGDAVNLPVLEAPLSIWGAVAGVTAQLLQPVPDVHEIVKGVVSRAGTSDFDRSPELPPDAPRARDCLDSLPLVGMAAQSLEADYVPLVFAIAYQRLIRTDYAADPALDVVACARIMIGSAIAVSKLYGDLPAPTVPAS